MDSLSLFCLNLWGTPNTAPLPTSLSVWTKPYGDLCTPLNIYSIYITIISLVFVNKFFPWVLITQKFCVRVLVCVGSVMQVGGLYETMNKWFHHHRRRKWFSLTPATKPCIRHACCPGHGSNGYGLENPQKNKVLYLVARPLGSCPLGEYTMKIA